MKQGLKVKYSKCFGKAMWCIKEEVCLVTHFELNMSGVDF